MDGFAFVLKMDDEATWFGGTQVEIQEQVVGVFHLYGLHQTHIGGRDMWAEACDLLAIDQ